MGTSLEIIKRHIYKLKDGEITELRNFLSDYSIKRDLEKECPSSYNRLYTVLKNLYGGRAFDFRFDYEEAVINLTELTEDEFKEYRLVGKAVIAAAKQELSKRNLSFKEKAPQNAGLLTNVNSDEIRF